MTQGKQITFFTFILLLVVACKESPGPSTKAVESSKDRYEHLLKTGDSIYATKSSLQAFEQSMVYYDSAYQLALQVNDTLMQANGLFAKARVYDAWGRQPLKTIELMQATVDLYKMTGKDKRREFYIRHILAHAYDKMQDSTNCVNTLLALCEDLKKLPDSTRQRMDFIPQMAHISTVVSNYGLAEQILSNLYNRTWIRNNPSTYRYEDNYYLTRCRIDIFKYKRHDTPYLDSLELTLQHLSNPIDSLETIHALMQLYGSSQRYEDFYKFFIEEKRLNGLAINERAVSSMENRLLSLELDTERRKAEAEAEKRSFRNIIIGILAVALVLISSLAISRWLVSKKYIRISQELDEKMQELNLANKEIQHRIKNNLNLISSLLHMQERKSPNPATTADLQTARLRIESIATLHDQLSRGHQTEASFQAYVQLLVQNILQCIESDRKIITQLSIAPLDVPHKQFVNIGLILNEWITNSVKYAKTEAALTLNLTINQADRQISIMYSDNGLMPSNTEQSGNGMGAEIVGLLVRQLKAKLQTMNGHPFHYQLEFDCGKSH
jgi:two-component sensor histidine kinase